MMESQYKVFKAQRNDVISIHREIMENDFMVKISFQFDILGPKFDIDNVGIIFFFLNLKVLLFNSNGVLIDFLFLYKDEDKNSN
jgi:hypothetical protein